MRYLCLLLPGLLVFLSGCQLPSRMPTGLTGSGSTASGIAGLDQTNQELHRQLAQTRQQGQVVEAELVLLKKQLAETAGQLQTQLTDGMTTTAPVLRADDSRQQRPAVVPIGDLVTVADGDVVRVEIPIDRLFETNGSQLSLAGLTLLDQVSQVLQKNYARQLIGIECHTTDTADGNVQFHRQTAEWGLAVLDRLAVGGVNKKQLFNVAHGANHPRYSNGSNEGSVGNRRVEIVIYPDTISPGS